MIQDFKEVKIMSNITYHKEGDYYIPNIVMPVHERVILNKYGRMRLNYLKEYKKSDYSIMLMEGTLNFHLKEIQEIAKTRVEQIITEQKAKSNLTEDFYDQVQNKLLYQFQTLFAHNHRNK